ncbi:MAG: type 1 glutamine amidotransferase [Proteobacteria bacterium]|nr:type 1 glutamine amidotransferase [Pseudomonadota bacterium]
MKFRLLQARLPTDLVRSEERASFAEKLNVPLEDVVPWDLIEGADANAIVDGVDAVLVGGSGEFGVTDGAPWLPAFFDALGTIADSGFPMFASCFGFQGLVVAYGGTVITDPEGSEVGSYELAVTEHGAADPLFSRLPTAFTAQEGHKDRAITLPTGLKHLVRSERCPYQAVRVEGRPVWATQFHPELSGAENAQRFGRYFDLYKSVFGEELARRKLESMRPSVESNELLLHFRDFLAERS